LRSELVWMNRGSMIAVTAISSARAATIPSSRMRRIRSAKPIARAPSTDAV
jgi:hypothetical protein